MRMKEEIQGFPSESYYFGDPKGLQLSLATGRYSNVKDDRLPPKLTQLLSALVSDFYSPIPIGNLFSKVYPEEHFDIEYSPAKVRQLISRLRKWFEMSKVNSQIVENKSRYKIKINNGIGIKLLQISSNGEVMTRNFELLRNHFMTWNHFTIEDVQNELKLSRSDFHRIARWAMQNKMLIRWGVGKKTCYKISSSQNELLAS